MTIGRERSVAVMAENHLMRSCLQGSDRPHGDIDTTANSSVGSGGRSLSHDHLTGGDESTRNEVDNVVAFASAGIRFSSVVKLLPIQMVTDGKMAATASLQVALLKTIIAGNDLRSGVQG